MRYLLLLLIVWTLCPPASYAQDLTGLDLIVRDGADQPVPGLSLSLTGADSMRRSATTDADGRATFAGLPGLAITLTAATTATGQSLVLDPTTPRDGLVLGLIPFATRVVPLRLVDGLVFLDPEEVFAGTDESTGAGVIGGLTPTPQAELSMIDAVSAADDPLDDRPARRVIPHLGWCVGGLAALLLALIVLLFGRQLLRIAP